MGSFRFDLITQRTGTFHTYFMLKKNVYFLYPAGYAGNYLQWTINVSDRDKSPSIPRDPLLDDGTSHGFVRKPTHQHAIKTLIWRLVNQPQDYRTYIVNCHDKVNWLNHAAYGASLLLRSDPNCVIVNIHTDTIDEIRYGALNTYLKWPVYFSATTPRPDFDYFAGQQGRTSIEQRNWFYDHWQETFPSNGPFKYDELQHNLDQNREWFEVRNQFSPHEVTADQYINFDTVPRDRIVDLPLVSIMQPGFINGWCDTLAELDIGDFDFEHAKSYHSTYTQAQKPLRYFSAIKTLREENKVDSWLLSNDLCQAFLLQELNIETLVPGWREYSTEKLIGDFLNLKIA